MLWRALCTAWNHAELWLFAVIAGLASTGVVVNDLLGQAHIALTPGARFGLENGTIVAIERYIGLLLASGTTSILTAALIFCALLSVGALAITVCQQILIVALHRAVHKKKRLGLRALVSTLHHHHFLRILGVDLLFHVLIFLTLSGGGMLLRTLPLAFPAGGALAILLAAAILFAAFVLNIIAMLTLIAVGEEHISILRGLQEGVARFLRHPLVACETALILFAANLLLSLGLLFGLVLIALPIGLLFAEAFAQASLGMVAAITVFGTLLVLGFTLAAAGFMTTFTYATWTMLVEYLNRSPFSSRFHAHSTRLLSRRTFSSSTSLGARRKRDRRGSKV